MAQKSRLNPPRHPGLAKLNRPRLGHIVHREQLVRRCDQLSSCTCTWITAPAGYGKTTHLVNYLDSKDMPCLWYQVDEEDADLASFFSYLGMAVESHIGRLPPLLTPEYFGDVPTFSRRWFRELYQSVENPFVIVFDNVQLVQRDASFHDVLRIAISEAPQGVRIFVASRERPSPLLVKALISEQIGVIGIEELMLTDAEAIAIAKMRFRHGFSEQKVQQLNGCVQGWVAGLVLLLPQLEQEKPSCRITEMLFDYFASEVVRLTDEQTRAFLRTTALLPEMTVPMVRRLTDMAQPEKLLEDLSQHNFFTYRSTGDEPVYQYHALFREFLLEYARQTLSNKELRKTQRQAASVLADAGSYTAAVELLKESKDWQALAGLVCQQAEGLLRQGRLQTLQMWLEGIPDEFLKQTPWLMFWLGHSKLIFNPSNARDCFQNAYEEFKDIGDPAGACLSWAAVVDSYWFEMDDFRPLHDWIAEFESLRPLYQSLSSPAIEARVVFAVFSALLVVQPDHSEFAEWEQRVLKLLEGDLAPDLRLKVADILMYYYVGFIGRRGHATRVLNFIRSTIDNPEVAAINLCAWRVYRSLYILIFDGSAERCLANLKVGLSTAREHGVHLYDVTLHLGCAQVHLTAGHCEAGREALAHAAKALDFRHSYEVGHYHYVLAWEAWLSDRLPEALEHMQLVLRGNKWADLHSQGLGYLGLAQIHAARGDLAEALRCLARVRPWVRRMHSKIGKNAWALTLAQFALDRGRRTRSLKCLRWALRWGREENYINFPFFRPETVALLCAEALEAGIETDYVKNLIDKRDLQPPGEFIGTLEQWPWRVKVYTLGHFSVWLNGEKLVFKRKAQQKPLELLKLISTFGGRGIAISQLADQLWPDAEGDSALRAFATTLHRLRRLLREDKVLLVQEGRLIVNTQVCWIDAWAFERLVKSSGEALSPAKPKLSAGQCVTMTHQILKLYQGAFIAAESEISSVVSTRERLRTRFLYCLSRLGTYLERSGHLHEAITCYQSGVEVEHLAEGLYLGLMRCYLALGERPEAMATYRRCKEILAANQDTPLSTKTNSLDEVPLRDQ
ncbi:MAG: BTAD domain-containing putative transcriptional regulator [Pseudomonadota bacterium]